MSFSASAAAARSEQTAVGSVSQPQLRIRKIHALLLHQAYAGLGEAGGTRHFELGSRLIGQGHRFTVIASKTSYLTGKEVVATDAQGGPEVRRVYAGAGYHASYVARVFAFLIFMVNATRAGLGVRDVDVVIGTTPPIFQAVAAMIVAKLRRLPFLLEVRDLWPEFAIEIGVLKNPVLIWIARRVETMLYRNARLIVVNSPAYREYLMKRGIAPERVAFVANGVDANAFQPELGREEFRAKWNFGNRFVVTYAGAMGMANDLGVVLDAAKLLEKRDDVLFVLAGDGKERAVLERRARELGLQNVLFTGPIPKADMPKMLAASDACVATLKNIPMFRTTYPNKVFDYMAAARPTILGIDGVIRQVVEAANGGIFVQPGDARAIASAVEMLASSPAKAKTMGAAARAYVAKNFDRDVQASDFAAAVQCVVPAGAPR